MTNPFDDESSNFVVLINDEGQHSLWPSYLDVPNGWRVTGPTGKREECLAWIDENWTDMRPNSLIRQIEEESRTREDWDDA